MNVAYVTKGAVGLEDMSRLDIDQFLGILKSIEALSE